MNEDRRKTLSALNLRIPIRELLPFLVPKLPKDKLIYKLQYQNAQRGGNMETIEFSPPVLAEDFLIDSNLVSGEYHIHVGHEKVVTSIIYTIFENNKNKVEIREYDFSVFELIDP